MTDWPVTLPQNAMMGGFAQSQVDNSIRSSMSYGPDKVRRRTTAALKTSAIPLRMTTAQLALLDTFYNDTIQVSGQFDWIDHVTQSAATYRFLRPPTIEPYGGGLWYVLVDLEMLP